MNISATNNASSRAWLSGLFVILLAVSPLTSAVAAELYGMPAARVEQSRGVDKNVDYQRLTQLGLWDDRNYQLTAKDLAYLPKGEADASGQIPAFFRVELRKMWPHLQTTGTAQYPRAAWPMFRKKYGGIQRNGKIWGSDFNANRVVPVNGEVQLSSILGANEPTVEMNPVNPMNVIAGSNNNGGQEMYYSQDGGATWTVQGVLPNTCCDPTVDWSSDGTKAYTAALSGPIGVSFWVSNDQGVTWEGRVDLTASGSDKEWIHVDRSPSSPHLDNIYVTYHNGNIMQFARSTDMGTSFDIQAFPSAPTGIGSDITTTSNGDIYYFYGATTIPNVTMLKSTDGGVTFEPPAEVAATNGAFDFPIPAMESRRAWIYAAADADRSGGPFDGSVYVSWTDTTGPESTSANNHTQIKVYYSRDGGATWDFSIPHETADVLEVDRFNQWMKVDEFGNVHVVYYDTRNSVNRTGVDLYYNISMDGGVTWDEPTRVSGATSANLTTGQEWGDYNGISVVGDKVIPIWSDNRDGGGANGNQQDAFAADVTNVGSSPTFLLGGSNTIADVCAPDSFDVALDVSGIQGFSNPVTLSTPGLPAGFGANYSTNPVAIGGSSVASINVGGTVAAGDYSFDIVGSATGVDDRAVAVSVGVADAVPGLVALTSPANGATDQNITTTFSWAAASQGGSYEVQVATDAGFTNLVDLAVVDGTSYTSTVTLETDTTYFWRVRSTNTCGQGAYSPASSFTTGNIICVNPALVTIDNQTVSSSLPLADATVLGGMTVTVDANHTWVGDLTITLVHEDTGTSVVLMDRPGFAGSGFGCREDDIDAEFNDNASVAVEGVCSVTPPAIGGMVIPEQALSAFAGESLGGTWRLDVADGAGGDGGTVNEWCLFPEGAGAPDTDGDGFADDVDNCTLVNNPTQLDTNGDGYGNACDPDLNNDGVVNFLDASLFSAQFNSTAGGDADFNGDGNVNFLDFSIFPGYFLGAPGPSAID